MTWTTFHRRGDVLRTVIDAADRRRDGLLPMDLPGVAETFGDELSLLGALTLRWHTRLAGHLERALMQPPHDTAEAVVGAWHATADELPGIRLVLDHYRAAPLDNQMATVLSTTTAKEQALLAAMAGQAEGQSLEARARATHRSVGAVA